MRFRFLQSLLPIHGGGFVVHEGFNQTLRHLIVLCNLFYLNGVVLPGGPRPGGEVRPLGRDPAELVKELKDGEGAAAESAR